MREGPKEECLQGWDYMFDCGLKLNRKGIGDMAGGRGMDSKK